MQGKCRRKRMAALALVVTGLGLSVFIKGISAAGEPPKGAPGGAPPPPEVAVVVVQPETITLTTELPGRTAPYLVAEVRPQVNGLITKRVFTEGANVKEGEVLYEIDPAPYQAAYDLSVASLARAEANLPPLELRAQRQKDLVPTGAVSHQDYDEVLALLKQAKAEIEYCKAAVKSARINLDYTRVVAPITGRIGRSNVTVGALATAHQGPPFATVQKFDPIYVDVTQSTAQLQRLQNSLKSGKLLHDEANMKKVQLLLEDGSPYGLEGTLQFRDVTVDQTTGSIILRILFPNPEEALLPGMFVRAVVTAGIKEQAIMVPQQAVSRNSKGEPLVMIVDAEGTAQQRLISLDRTIKDKWLVSGGLAPGDQIIVEGLQQARPGTQVRVVPWEGDEAGQPAAANGTAPAAEAN